MCGICGFYSFEKKISYDELHTMADSLSHRGPDAQGFFSDDIVGLGHRRLSILDLSQAANQPMHSHNNRYVICYNGEVYNFREIAEELNIKPTTSSDTEIILESFAKLGVEFIHKLNGMFAIAIYDKQEKKLFLFRDRMGIKPLFYYWDKENFLFTSEIKSLFQISFIKKNFKIRHESVSSFLQLGYIPEPNTIYKNIFKFPAGNFLVISENEFSLNPYWKLEDQLSENTLENFDIAKKQLCELLTSSVKYRMISDVPFGTFLSGGTDSSLITAIASQHVNKLNTFSIGFKESKYNEAKYAKEISAFLKTNHHELMVSEKDAVSMVGEILDTYDEPFADSSAIPTMIVAKFARQNVKMTLSGDGGDELFFGYGAYHWAERLAHPAVNTFKKPMAFALSKLGMREKRASHLFRYTNKQKIKSHIFSQEQYFFSCEETISLLNPDNYEELNLEEDYSSLKRKLSPKEEQALFDMKYYLKDDLLVKVDRATMKYGLETRVPFLDYRIVEFALNLSPELKSKNGTDKFLLKEILYDFIPKKYFNRPKWGFAIPLKEWLKKELAFLLEETLNKTSVEQAGIVRFDVVHKLKKKFINGEDYLYNRLWSLIVLHKFLAKTI